MTRNISVICLTDDPVRGAPTRPDMRSRTRRSSKPGLQRGGVHCCSRHPGEELSSSKPSRFLLFIKTSLSLSLSAIQEKAGALLHPDHCQKSSCSWLSCHPYKFTNLQIGNCELILGQVVPHPSPSHTSKV